MALVSCSCSQTEWFVFSWKEEEEELFWHFSWFSWFFLIFQPHPNHHLHPCWHLQTSKPSRTQISGQKQGNWKTSECLEIKSANVKFLSLKKMEFAVTTSGMRGGKSGENCWATPKPGKSCSPCLEQHFGVSSVQPSCSEERCRACSGSSGRKWSQTSSLSNPTGLGKSWTKQSWTKHGQTHPETSAFSSDPSRVLAQHFPGLIGRLSSRSPGSPWICPSLGWGRDLMGFYLDDGGVDAGLERRKARAPVGHWLTALPQAGARGCREKQGMIILRIPSNPGHPRIPR